LELLVILVDNHDYPCYSTTSPSIYACRTAASCNPDIPSNLLTSDVAALVVQVMVW
jgi:hypothetical protein